jgi:trans-aconitate methyltransferase
VGSKSTYVSQCKRPRGWLGRFTLRRMNARHSRLTDWGLEHVSIEQRSIILDVGCGGGRTVSKLASMAPEGKVYGIDFSEESVAASERTNARWIKINRVEIPWAQQGVKNQRILASATAVQYAASDPMSPARKSA